MKILTIDFGCELVKVCIFEAKFHMENKKSKVLDEFVLKYVNIFKKDTDNLSIVTISHILEKFTIDLTLIVLNKEGLETVPTKFENRLSKEELVDTIDKQIKDTKGNIITCTELQNYDRQKSYIDVVLHKLQMPDYERLIECIKSLRLGQTAVCSPASTYKYFIPDNENCIVYDLGSKVQSMMYFEDKILNHVSELKLSLSLIDEIIEERRPDIDKYKIKHTDQIWDLLNDSREAKTDSDKSKEESFRSTVNAMSKKLNDFIIFNGIGKDTKVYVTGGYSNMNFQLDMFDYPLHKLKLPKKLLNRDKIEEELIPYLIPSIGAVMGHFDNRGIDFLENKKDLVVLLTRLDAMLNRTVKMRRLVAAIFIGQIILSIPICNELTNKYSQYATVDTSMVSSSKVKYDDLRKKLDIQLSKSDLISGKFKLQSLIGEISVIKPDKMNIERIEYSNGSVVLTVYTKDLEKTSVFVKGLQQSYAKVEVKSPETLQTGQDPVFKLKILASEQKSK